MRPSSFVFINLSFTPYYNRALKQLEPNSFDYISEENLGIATVYGIPQGNALQQLLYTI